MVPKMRENHNSLLSKEPWAYMLQLLSAIPDNDEQAEARIHQSQGSIRRRVTNMENDRAETIYPR